MTEIKPLRPLRWKGQTIDSILYNHDVYVSVKDVAMALGCVVSVQTPSRGISYSGSMYAPVSCLQVRNGDKVNDLIKFAELVYSKDDLPEYMHPEHYDEDQVKTAIVQEQPTNQFICEEIEKLWDKFGELERRLDEPETDYDSTYMSLTEASKLFSFPITARKLNTVMKNLGWIVPDKAKGYRLVKKNRRAKQFLMQYFWQAVRIVKKNGRDVEEPYGLKKGSVKITLQGVLYLRDIITHKPELLG